MLRKGSLRFAALAACALAAVACGKKNAEDAASPLAFVPADTPYVFANLEPMPEAAVAQWRRQMQDLRPVMVSLFDDIAAHIGDKSSQQSRLINAIVNEIRDRTTTEQWQQIGLGPKVRGAIYGVGVLPVARFESTDIDAFKASFERVAAASGATLGSARIGEQDVRTIDGEEATGLIAFEGRDVVVTIVPKDADEALKRRVLGLDRPAQSLADTGAFDAFDKARGYLPYGSGWVDTRRLVALIGTPEAGVPTTAFDATCRAEYDAIATKMPRVSFGYTKLDGTAMDMRMRLELEPALAKALVDLGSATPGIARTDALFDMAFALPVLKARDFVVAQADAVAKAPFQCAQLADLNAEFAKAKTSLDRILPPPVADLTGVRITLDHFTMPADTTKPPSDFAGSVLIGSNNPMFLVGLAQMSAPPLQNLHLNPDGKPVALPAEALGQLGGPFEVQAALGAKTLGVSIGKDAAATLSAAVMQAPAADGTVMSFDASGRIYSLMSDLFGNKLIADSMPAEQKSALETQRKMYALYAQWFKHIHARLAFVPEGVDLVESVELNPAQ
jgi:hypothetical protein